MRREEERMDEEGGEGGERGEEREKRERYFGICNLEESLDIRTQ